jgi:hypothetical protein
MPKIPTFQTEGRITAEVGGVKSNVQVPLSQTLGTALAPATQAIVQHRVQEKNFENKTEALKLENEALLQFTDTLDRASRLDNKDQAFELIKTESERIKNNFSNKASNKYVQTMFNNNFYGEVQKGIFKVNSAVSTNIIQSLDNEVGIKKNRLLTQAYLDKDPLAFKLIGSELKKLYEDNFQGRIDVDEYNRLIQNIPSELEVFQANQMITENPIQALKDLKDKNKFINIDLNQRDKLIREAKSSLLPQVKDEILNIEAAGKNGDIIPYDDDLIKDVLSTEDYNKFKRGYAIILKTADDIKKINQSTDQETAKVIREKDYSGLTYIEKQEIENALIDAQSSKKEDLAKDPVAFLYRTDDEIERLIKEYDADQNPESQSKKKLELTNILVEKQKKLGQDDSLIRVMGSSESNQFVSKYMIADENEKINMLKSLEIDFGDYSSNALAQLTANGLPVTAELSLIFDNPTLTKKFMSFDSEEKKKNLDQYLKDQGASKQIDIRNAIQEGIQEFENVVMIANQFDTSVAFNKLSDIKDTLTYYAANEMLVNGQNEKKAIESAINLIKGNFDVEETYFVPRKYNGKNLSDNHVEKFKEKLDIVQNYYIDEYNPDLFKSTFEDDDKELSEEMKYQIKNNGSWINSADGSGVVFGIQFNDGSFGLLTKTIIDQDTGEELSVPLKINFDDISYNVPYSSIKIDPRIVEKTEMQEPRGSYGSYYSESIQKKITNTNKEILGKR